VETLGLLGIGARVTKFGTTADAADDGPPASACNAEAHPDRAYHLNVSAPASLRLTLTTSGWNPALELRIGISCTTPAASKCAQNGSPISILEGVAPGSQYYVWIDGGNAGGGTQAGPYSLLVEVLPP
jgi:hypothetical protein